jgi:hypothetical protein
MRTVAVALGIAAFFAAGDASAFCRTHTCRGAACEFDDDGCAISGKPLFWPGGCFGFSVEQSLSAKIPKAETRVAVQRAFFAWTEVECSPGKRSTLAFKQTADATCRKSEYRKDAANVNVIFFRDNEWLHKDIDNTLAKTTVTFNSNTGEILDADMEVNTAHNEVTVGDSNPRYDLQAIMTHEVGHLLGLAHSPFPESTMFASYEPGMTEQRTLSNDDVSAICTVYPPDRVASCDPTPRGGLDLACASAPAEEDGCSYGRGSPGTFAFGLLAIALALTGRARRMTR